MAGGESKGSRRYDKENLLWQSTVAIKSDPVGSGKFYPESERDKWLEQVRPLAKELHEDMDDNE